MNSREKWWWRRWIYSDVSLSCASCFWLCSSFILSCTLQHRRVIILRRVGACGGCLDRRWLNMRSSSSSFVSGKIRNHLSEDEQESQYLHRAQASMYASRRLVSSMFINLCSTGLNKFNYKSWNYSTSSKRWIELHLPARPFPWEKWIKKSRGET